MAHIILIDDSELALEFTRMMLEAEGHTVGTTADPAEFWKLAEGEPRPNLLIVDAVMPEISGAELIAQVRNHASLHLKNIPILLSSALDDQLVPADGVLLLPKPFGPEELQQALTFALG